MVGASEYRIALVIPRSGSPGLYGPSCKRCAELAVLELNQSGGILGSPVSLLQVDGAQKPLAVADAVAALLESNVLSAVVGLHDSDVRQAVVEAIDGRVPYIYAANYEGPSAEEDVISIGLTAAQQICGSVAWLAANRSVRSWYFIGNDYLWPRSSAGIFKEALSEAGLDLIGTDFVPMGENNYSPYLKAIEQTEPDAVFAALVGADAIAFNRQFERRGLDRQVIRFMPLFEENSLLALGAHIGRGLFTAGTFFADMNGPAEKAFQQSYETQFGQDAPQLNGFGVACYEAVKLLGVIASKRGAGQIAGSDGVQFPTIAGQARLQGSNAVRDVLLAEAVAGSFDIKSKFWGVKPDGSYRPE